MKKIFTFLIKSGEKPLELHLKDNPSLYYDPKISAMDIWKVFCTREEAEEVLRTIQQHSEIEVSLHEEETSEEVKYLRHFLAALAKELPETQEKE